MAWVVWGLAAAFADAGGPLSGRTSLARIRPLLGDGQGAFATAARPLDGDGRPDLVVANSLSGSFTVLRNLPR